MDRDAIRDTLRAVLVLAIFALILYLDRAWRTEKGTAKSSPFFFCLRVHIYASMVYMQNRVFLCRVGRLWKKCCICNRGWDGV